MPMSSAIMFAMTLVQPRKEESRVSSGDCPRSVPLRAGGSSMTIWCCRARVSVRAGVAQVAVTRIGKVVGMLNDAIRISGIVVRQ